MSIPSPRPWGSSPKMRWTTTTRDARRRRRKTPRRRSSASRRALSIDPELGEAQFNLAVMLGHQGKAKEAREAMNAYIEHNTPSDEESEEIREFLKNLEGA